ncbi:MAG TPA: tetratricopeptide repeat protein [Herpetosiphonaceae bacterium]|nr:tetratricopeptide repeat protein [Herpetosiphonaceae bacterium]
MSRVAAVSFAELLRRYRARARLSQEQLAEQAGLSLRAVSDLERGINRMPRNATVRLLAETLKLSEAEHATFAAAARGEVSLPAVSAAPAHNLPPQLTSFIGRAQDVAAVVRLILRPSVRLVTLTGPGGAGKTRLSLRAAEELLPSFPDGVRFVDLAPITDPDLVLQAIASTLGVGETAGISSSEGLREHLREKNLLLVLDNFERVVLAGNLLTQLLVAAPGLKMLVTSRVVLRVRGEHEYAVPPLATPPPEPRSSWEEVARYESVELFLTRARAVRLDFALDTGNAQVIAEICRRLDGLPLAIELAAARVHVLSPQAMLPRLADRFSLLTRGAQDVPARQRTLRGTLDWSYGLLHEKEQQLFAQLGVFAGSPTLEAIEAVGGPDVLDIVSSLVDSSLLRQEELPGGEARFRLLETVREYALARLAESGAADAARLRHAEFYLRLAEAARHELTGPHQKTWLDRLEAEHDDLRAALASLHMQGKGKLLLRLAAALYQFWYFHGHLSEGRRWLERALATSPGVESKARAYALIAAGQLAWRQGDYGCQEVFLAEGLSLSRKLGDKLATAAALGGLGNRAWNAGQREPAAELFEASLQLYREIGDKRGVAIMLKNLGALADDAGDYLRAIELVEESLALRRELGDVRGVAVELRNLASVWHELGEHGRARALLIESLRICRELGEKRVMVLCLEMFATLAGACGEVERAARLWGASEALRDALGTPAQPHQAVADEAEKQRARAQIGDIAWAAAWEQGQAMTLEQAVAYALEEGSSDRPGSRQT